MATRWRWARGQQTCPLKESYQKNELVMHSLLEYVCPTSNIEVGTLTAMSFLFPFFAFLALFAFPFSFFFLFFYLCFFFFFSSKG